jgi:signal transduction histidine kinase
MASGGRLSISTAKVSLDGQYHSLHPEVRPGEYVLIAVTDNGEGMLKSVLDKVFEPFFTTKEVGKGSGLGLSMVYGFIKQSNGHVSIYGEPGLGTTVNVGISIGNIDRARATSRVRCDPDQAISQGRARASSAGGAGDQPAAMRSHRGR